MHHDLARVLELGWRIFPTSPRSKASAFKAAVDHASNDPATIERWLREYPGCGWRVACGASGLFVLDVDRPGTHKADGFAAMAQLTAKHGALPPRPMTRTGGSGGAALFFRHQGELLLGQSGKPLPGLDPHRGRQAVVIPPSTHPVTKGAYAWRVAPWDVPPPPIPRWLAGLLQPPPEPEIRHDWRPSEGRATQAVIRAIHIVEAAGPGQANNTLNRAAWSLGRWCGAGLLTERDAESALLTASQRRSIPFREARDTIRSGIKAGRLKPVEARWAT